MKWEVKRLIPLFIIILLLTAAGLNAQTTGKIIGAVTDAETGEPMPGANVMIDGTMLGAATNMNGEFFIINVPPGQYSVRVQVIGYQPYVVENVTVSVNRSTSIEAALKQTVLEGEVVIVTASKLSTKKDQTSSIKNVSSKQIAVLPVENMAQVIEMQAGVVEGHFRGGRLSGVSYLIDGMQVDEAFVGESSTVELEKEVVQDLEVITGTFDAEYGKAMSGIVNMVTKDGSNTFHGSVYGYFGNYMTGHDDIFVGNKPGDVTRIQDYKFQLEGPVWKDRINFIVNGRYEKDMGYLNGIRRFNVDDFSNMNDALDAEWPATPWDAFANGSRYYSEHTGDGEFVPMDDRETVSLFGKLSFKLTPSLKTSLTYTLNKEDNADYNHYWKYNPDGLGMHHTESSFYAFQMNHLINRSAFHDLKISYRDHGYGYYLYEDPLDLRHVAGMYSAEVGDFSSGGTQKGKVDRTDRQLSVKYDLNVQLGMHHNIKGGGQYSRYEIINNPTLVRDVMWDQPEVNDFVYDPAQQKMVIKPWDPEIYPADNIGMDRYKKEPYDFSAYLRDKMEYGDLVLNVGLRYDYFNANTWTPSNRRNPSNQMQYDDPAMMSDSLTADPQAQLSPRFGLSYTLGRSAVLHFSYGHFFQMPPMYALYQNYRFKIPTGNFETTHGNPEIKAQKEVKYEMGLWQEIAGGLGMEVSVYYSDIYDLLTTVVWTTYNEIEYGVYNNKDYANSKGFELKLDWASGPVSAVMNYTLQYTRGNADNPSSTYNRLAQNQDPIPTLIPLAWDQRHTVNLNIAYSQPGYSMSITGYYNSGLPYDIDAISESNLARQNLLPNNGKRPANFTVDLQGYYTMPLRQGLKLRFTLLVNNLLDQLNEMGVNGLTGRAYSTILRPVEEQTFRSNFNTVMDQYENPAMYAAPRQVKLGVGIIF